MEKELSVRSFIGHDSYTVMLRSVKGPYIVISVYINYNQINARALISQSAMVYCSSKLMEKSRVF